MKAAYAVLHEAGGGPMHYKDLVAAVTGLKLVRSVGDDPEHSIHSALCKHIRSRGERSWFLRPEPGCFALTPQGKAAGGEFEPSWSEVAARVLREAGKPLHYSEIRRIVLERGLKRERPGVRWGDRSVGNELAATAKRQGGSGRAGTIRRVGRGVYDLAQ